MWQAIYPNSSYVTPQIDAAGTFTNTPGSTEDVNSRKFRIYTAVQ